MAMRETEPLHETLELYGRIKSLKALLELQRWQLGVWDDRLHSNSPGGVAARRLLALKRIEETHVLRKRRAP